MSSDSEDSNTMSVAATETTLLTRSQFKQSLRSLRKLEGPKFSSAFGFLMASLGCMAGSGNVWRFPRMAAHSSDGKGCLVFLLIWLVFLFLWNIPMVILEYGVGRHTKVTLIKSFKRMMGENFVWGGLWISVVTFLVACYYAVIVGWCLYYSCIFIARAPPSSYNESQQIFEHYSQQSGWSFVTLLVTVILTGLICLGGISSVEKVNMVMVPVSLLILLGIFIYSMTTPAAGEGLKFLFTPHWESFTNPQVWGEAVMQNLLGVSAGMGLLLTYSNFLNEENSVVKYGVLIPIGNNVICLLTAMMMFAVVFSAPSSVHVIGNITTSVQPMSNFNVHLMGNVSTVQPMMSNVHNVQLVRNSSDILSDHGPGGTGITFIWLPVMFGSIGFMGRMLCGVFYLSLFLLGLSAVVACIFVGIKNLHDAFEVSRPVAIFVMINLMYCVGVGSIMSPEFLRSQDNIWNSALIISALLLVIMSVTYGIGQLRETGINERSLDDWELPIIWQWAVRYLCPVELILILVWWAYDTTMRSINSKDRWYAITADGVLTYLIAWVGLLIISLFINLIVVCCKPRWFMALEDELWEEDDMEVVYETRPSMSLAPSAAPGIYDHYGALEDIPEEVTPPGTEPPPPEEATDTTPLQEDG